MIEGIPRISVLVICYKQEELIKRAINSLLAQKDYVYEICVSDDCSPDKTWEVLREYDRQYPGLFKLHRNDPNVGIFENIEYTWSMPTGDIIYRLAGDDECGEHWFETVVKYIRDNQIDYKNELFCIYGDYKAVYPNGDSFVFSNGAVKSGIDPLRLSIRGIIGNRSAVYSTKVLNCFKHVSQGKSHIAESAIDRQLPLFTKKVYYISEVGNIYYARVGVSFHIDEEIHKQREGIETYAMEIITGNGYKVTTSDKFYMLMKSESAKLYRDKSFSRLYKIFKLKINSFDPRLSFKAFRIKRYVFAFRLRFPHSKPVKMYI